MKKNQVISYTLQLIDEPIIVENASPLLTFPIIFHRAALALQIFHSTFINGEAVTFACVEIAKKHKKELNEAISAIKINFERYLSNSKHYASGYYEN